MSDLQVLSDYQRGLFVRGNANLTTEMDEDGWPVAVVGEDRIPLVDTVFDLQIIQPGNVRNDKSLAKHIGELKIVQLDEFREEGWFLPITIINYGFRKYGEYAEGADNQLQCWSNDGLQPSPRAEMPCSDECAKLEVKNGVPYLNVTCSEAQWLDGKKPSCAQYINVALLDLERLIPVRLSLHGTGLGAWNQLQRAYKNVRNIAKLKGKSINDYVLKITTDNEGTFVKPNMEFIEAPEKFGKTSRFRPILQHYLETLFTRPIRDLEAASDQGTIEVTDASSSDSPVEDFVIEE